MIISADQLKTDQALYGFVQICKIDPTTGQSTVVVDQPNLILKGGATLLAKVLAGDPSAKIWGMYVGYNNNNTFSAPTIDVEYSNPFSGFSTPFGYLREPLTFTPNFASSANHTDNVVLFTTLITSATAAGGAAFGASSRFYEVALVAAPAANDPTKDIVFSRTNFNPVLFDTSYNFSITWGVRFLIS